jgi:hypothetical protein
MKLAAIALATLIGLSGTNALTRDKPARHRTVVTKPGVKPGPDGGQRALPSYANPMPAR